MKVVFVWGVPEKDGWIHASAFSTCETPGTKSSFPRPPPRYHRSPPCLATGLRRILQPKSQSNYSTLRRFEDYSLYIYIYKERRSGMERRSAKKGSGMKWDSCSGQVKTFSKPHHKPLEIARTRPVVTRAQSSHNHLQFGRGPNKSSQNLKNSSPSK